jgi:gamma-glutamyl-gamma-aminobutyrate hydrolase PuuD
MPDEYRWAAKLQEGPLMGRPIIGITSELDAARWGDWIREAAVSPVSYIRAVERAGGAPVLLPPVPPSSVAAFLDTLDGVLFTGGRDVDPALYAACTSSPSPVAARSPRTCPATARPGRATPRTT